MPGADESGRTGSFWATLPGILTGTAGVIGAIAAVLALFHSGGKDNETKTVSSASRVAVPDVVGEPASSAKAQLGSRGFKVVDVNPQCATRTAMIVHQEPQGGTKVDRGTTVSLNVASGVITRPRESLRKRLPIEYTVSGKVCGKPSHGTVWFGNHTNQLFSQAEVTPPGNAGEVHYHATWTRPGEYKDGRQGFSIELFLVVGDSATREIQRENRSDQPVTASLVTVLDKVDAQLR